MAELNKQEIQSPELQEVMSEIPGRFLKWGLFLFFAIILVLISLCIFIRYPVIVSAPVTLTTYSSPAALVSKSGGKIAELFVHNEDVVYQNRPIALIENPASYSDVMILYKFVNSLKVGSDWQKNVKILEMPSDLSLGEVQGYYTRFTTTWKQLKENLKEEYISTKLKLLEKEIIKQEEYLAELMSQKVLAEEDLRIQITIFHRDSLLKDSFIIAKSDLEKSKQALLQKETTFSSVRASIKNNELAILRMKETHLDLQSQLSKETYQYGLDLDESLQLLQVAIDQWIEKYIIKSPLNGKITFTGFWNINQVIKTGDIFATVIPDDGIKMIVRAHIPISGIGRVKVMQQVNIKLSGFPYIEFGVIKGKIKSLSLVPSEVGYIAEIDLINGMKSSYNREINFVQEMDGTADIITDKTRLIFKFIDPLRMIFSQNKY